MPDPGTLDPIDDATPPVDIEPTDAHDLAVQAALYKAAIGGERWRESVTNGQVVLLREEVRPDVGAAKKWLESRRPGTWREPDTAQDKPRSISITVTVHGQPRVTIGETYEHEGTSTPAPGLIGQAGAGDP